MSVFTDKELEYLVSQPLGRLATINEEGKPQVTPVGFRYNPQLDMIEIGGIALGKSKKFSNIQKNPNVSFVIDDVRPPWQIRGVEIRGSAETFETGGKEAFGAKFPADGAMIRICPAQIISWGLEDQGQNRKVR